MTNEITFDAPLVLDGGLATELERRGYNLDDPLWSAKLLLDNPDAIRQLHEDYYKAGAQCVITSSYQATIPGFCDRGLTQTEAKALIHRTVELACQSRDNVRSVAPADVPLYVAASIGPYGAFLHDGSEYRGDYGLSFDQLVDFHRDRFELLAAGDADWLAFETIPCLLEAHALVRLLESFPDRRAWLSFSCCDLQRLSSGEPIADAARELGSHPQILALGVNCTAPEYVENLVSILRSETDKPIVVYPNAGEVWDPQRRCWTGENNPERFADLAQRWRTAGASLLGGCCRTGPEHIRLLKRRLQQLGE